MSNHPQPPPPLSDTGDGHLSAEETAAAAAAAPAGARPRAAPYPDSSSSSGGLPLAPIPPNPPPLQIPLSVPGVAAPHGGLPASITHIVDLKLALDGSTFAQWRNYLTLILARHHAEAHVQTGAAARSSIRCGTMMITRSCCGSTPRSRAIFSTSPRRPAGSTAYMIWTRLHEYFLENEAELAMHLWQEFWTAVRRDRSINDYRRHL